MIKSKTGNNFGLKSVTAREKKIIFLIGMGLTNQEIARELIVTERIIQYHYKEILRKFNVKNRLNLVIYAYQLGLFET